MREAEREEVWMMRKKVTRLDI